MKQTICVRTSGQARPSDDTDIIEVQTMPKAVQLICHFTAVSRAVDGSRMVRWVCIIDIKASNSRTDISKQNALKNRQWVGSSARCRDPVIEHVLFRAFRAGSAAWGRDECDIRLFAAETVYSSTYPLALYALYCFCCFHPFHNWIDDDLWCFLQKYMLILSVSLADMFCYI